MSQPMMNNPVPIGFFHQGIINSERNEGPRSISVDEYLIQKKLSNEEYQTLGGGNEVKKNKFKKPVKNTSCNSTKPQRNSENKS